ncbi:unnamed protein product [Clonostachys byssicola]|uniref:Uncharacterized protein n=1 Tax=Clonostachys byssicola TaxID=160290 RepID=A0A9N9Y6M0_9HYPO|nr:unnamed protein product [Clonostachys byssicola]
MALSQRLGQASTTGRAPLQIGQRPSTYSQSDQSSQLTAGFLASHGSGCQIRNPVMSEKSKHVESMQAGRQRGAPQLVGPPQYI